MCLNAGITVYLGICCLIALFSAVAPQHAIRGRCLVVRGWCLCITHEMDSDWQKHADCNAKPIFFVLVEIATLSVRKDHIVHIHIVVIVKRPGRRLAVACWWRNEMSDEEEVRTPVRG